MSPYETAARKKIRRKTFKVKKTDIFEYGFKKLPYNYFRKLISECLMLLIYFLKSLSNFIDYYLTLIEIGWGQI